MNMKNIKSLLAVISLALATILMQGSAMAQQKNDPKFNKMMKDGFRADGIAGLERIDQDETQKFCSDPVFASSKQGEKMRVKIQKINMDSIKQPSDGKYIGDWKKGEAIAQSGRALPGLILQLHLLAAVAITVTKLIRKRFLMERLGLRFGTTASFVVTRMKWLPIPGIV